MKQLYLLKNINVQYSELDMTLWTSEASYESLINDILDSSIDENRLAISRKVFQNYNFMEWTQIFGKLILVDKRYSLKKIIMPLLKKVILIMLQIPW